MKRTKEFIKRNIAGEIVLVPSGQTAREFNGMVTLTGAGEFIWEHIEETESFSHLVQLILEEYEVDKDTASQDAAGFIMQLLQAGMVRPTGHPSNPFESSESGIAGRCHILSFPAMSGGMW